MGHIGRMVVIMGQKKIKRKAVAPTVDPNLDEVDEDRQKEIFYDEETNDVVITHHYRRQWGDDFDADVDELLNIQENNELIVVLLGLLQKQREHPSFVNLITEKSTPETQEGNPLKSNKEGE